MIEFVRRKIKNKYRNWKWRRVYSKSKKDGYCNCRALKKAYQSIRHYSDGNFGRPGCCQCIDDYQWSEEWEDSWSGDTKEWEQKYPYQQ